MVDILNNVAFDQPTMMTFIISTNLKSQSHGPIPIQMVIQQQEMSSCVIRPLPGAEADAKKENEKEISRPDITLFTS